MSFFEALKRFSVKLETKTRQAFVAGCAAIKNSIVEGSPLTGSPGQPVGDPATDPNSGNLRDSWTLEFEDANHALISTNVIYAPHNEYGITEDGRPYVQRSAVGGRHSVALTMAGAQRLMDAEAARLGA